MLLSDEIMMKDVMDFFSDEHDRRGAKTIYAVLITRTTYYNPLTADGFFVQLIDRRGMKYSYWSFRDMENMMYWLGQSLTMGFGDEKPEWIEERLWDSLLEWEEKYRYGRKTSSME